MASFAPVAPPQLLRSLKEKWGEDILGRYHLVLAHDIVQNRDLWKGLLPDDSTVIIDNSIIELGKPVEKEVMLEAYKILEDYNLVVVLPDTFDDARKTVTDSVNYNSDLQKVLPSGFQSMLVLQAKTLIDIDYVINVTKQLLAWNPYSWIAIPRRIADNMGTRAYALYKVLNLKLQYPDLGLHLMGFSNNIQDDIFCAQHTGVDGIDSAVPLRLGQRGIQLDFGYVGDQAGPRGTYWEDDHKEAHMRTYYNLIRIRQEVDLQSDYIPELKEGII